MSIIAEQEARDRALYLEQQVTRIKRLIDDEEVHIKRLERDIADANATITQLRLVRADAEQLNLHVRASIDNVAHNDRERHGISRSVVQCVRSFLLDTVNGAMKSLNERVAVKEEKLEAAIKHLADLREGIKQFLEA